METYIVIVGKACDTLFMYGPFDTAADATDWAEAESITGGVVSDEPWCISVLNPAWQDAIQRKEGQASACPLSLFLR